MVKLWEKIVNCFSSYLDRLNVGLANQNYEMLYNACLVAKNNINNPFYIQYFYNNLKCPINIKLTVTNEMHRVISSTLSQSPTVLNSFNWNEEDITSLKTYSITSDIIPGEYNFFYVAVPQELNVAIYDEMGNLLFNSLISGSYQFTLAGTTVTSKGKINAVYKKKNMFNSTNPITFNVKIF